MEVLNDQIGGIMKGWRLLNQGRRIQIAFALFLLLAFFSAVHAQTGIATKYSRDVGIEGDAAVIFADNFEDSRLVTASKKIWVGGLGTEWIKYSNDVPSTSSGKQSLWMADSINMDLYTIFTQKYRTLYFRWYMKYERDQQFHHEGPGIAGGNPVGAGIKPNGTYFSCSFEKANGENRFDTYSYWKDMGCSGGCYGNYLINDASLTVWPERWICVEVKFTLNEPVTMSNGELTVWWDGKQVCNRTGFQWRTDTATFMSKFDLEHYNSDPNHAPYMGDIWYDDLVIATQYIGPINTGPVSLHPVSPAHTKGLDLQIRPSTDGRVRFVTEAIAAGPVSLRILDVGGRRVWEDVAIASDPRKPSIFVWKPQSNRQGVHIGALSQGDAKAFTRFVLHP